MSRSVWYFPGDPPVFDLLFDAGVLVVTCALVVWLLTLRRTGTWPRVASRVALLVLLVGTVSALPGAALITYRHGSAWQQVRSAIREHSARIKAAVGSRSSPLSQEEFIAIRQKYLPVPVVLQLEGWGPVELRMAHGVPPYVGIDFGGGAHALFEPMTMRCIYSD